MVAMPAHQSAEPLLTLEEYLRTSYRPDCDFVDGRIENRLMGWYSHARTVTLLSWMLCGKQGWDTQDWLPLLSVRTRVAATRIRCPDVCVVARGGPKEQILSSPPLAVFEVLEPEDGFSKMMEKLADFERFGVKQIWIIDPERRTAYRYIAGGLEMVRSDELCVPGTPIRAVLSELFAELDRG